MKAYALYWDGAYRNLMVATCPTLDDAKAVVDAARADGGIAAAADVDLDKSGPALVGLYNALRILADGHADPATQVTRFATRADGQRRVFALLEANFKNAPEVAAPPKVEDDSAANSETETTTNEDDMAVKGKKKVKKAKAAPAAKKPKKEKGSKALVREDSSRGKLLKLAVNNPGISVKSLATRAEISGEGSATAETRVKMRLRKVAENVGATVSFEDEKVAFDLPKGVTLDSIFGRA